jgi:tetratricopeptide (TPR) repeat protein
MEPRDQTFRRNHPTRESGESSTLRRQSRRPVPSTPAYMVAATATAGALFFLLWWMLQGEENPWVPAGLAASVVMLVAVASREAIIRIAWSRHMLELDRSQRHGHTSRRSHSSTRFASVGSTSWRALQRQAAEVDAGNSLPEAHREIYQLCAEYLASTEEAMRKGDLTSENRLALRAYQERARALQRHHLLTWARDSARSLTREAQQRVRLHEKIEIANRALECLDSALQIYPDDHELNESAGAVREFITSSRVAHWVELAERAAFKGHYRRAIDCYRDALFFLTRDDSDNAHQATAERITREIELLRARVATKTVDAPKVENPHRSDH